MRVLAALLMISTPALAHDWYSGTRDPVTGGGCCGVADCAVLKIEPGMLTGEVDGYRLRLTAEQAGRINPARKMPVDTLIVWDRMQPSPDGNFHLCLPTYPTPNMAADYFCFFAPPST